LSGTEQATLYLEEVGITAFVNMNFFGAAHQKKVDPAEQAKVWKRQLAKESRSIDRDIAKLKQAEKASMNECRKLIKQGYVPASKVLAKEVVNTRRAMNRMYSAQAQLNSVSMGLSTSVGEFKCISSMIQYFHRDVVTVFFVYSNDQDAGMHPKEHRGYASHE
jgi:hypothetical protein